MELSKDDLEAQIVWKLFHNGKFGKGHFTEETILKGIPKNMWGDARATIKDLIKKDIIQYKDHDHGGAYSLNNQNKILWKDIIDKKMKELGII
ncbi:MAG: hypothetical protein WC376_01480 [Candidatus Nanoarchaeia archaeon]